MSGPVRQQQRHLSAKLTPEQAVILEAAFTKAQAPAAVAYNLSFTGITPALKVEVIAEFTSLYKEFDMKFWRQYSYSGGNTGQLLAGL